MDPLIRAPIVTAHKFRLAPVGAPARSDLPARNGSPLPAAATPPSTTTSTSPSTAFSGAASGVIPTLQRSVSPADLRRQLETQIRAELQAEVKQQAKLAEEAAQRRGHAEGLKHGQEVAAAQALQHERVRAQEFEALMRSMETAAHRALEALGERATDIALVATTRLIGRELATPALVQGMVKEVLQLLEAPQAATVRLHPKDLAALNKALGASLRLDEHALTLVESDALPCGGCTVDTPLGSLDASLETQLKHLRDGMVKAEVPGDVP